MFQQIYYLDKSTDTLADTEAAYGLAVILSRIIPAEAEMDVRLKDDGSHYSVILERPIEPEWVENAPFFLDVPYILTDKQKQKGGYPADIPEWVDYELEKQIRANYFEMRKTLPKEALRPGATPDQFPELKMLKPPARDWSIWAKVNQMSALSAYNGMIEAWYEGKRCFAGYLKLILHMCATMPNDIEGTLAAWKKLAKAHGLTASAQAAATQVYNPATGKGANRPKADALSIGGQKNFWLQEYLKLVGMRYAGLPRVVSGSKDRKTYVLLPKNIKLTTNNKVFRVFQDSFWAYSAIKMDIMAALKFTHIFLEQWQQGQLSEIDEMFGIQPGDYIQGLAMVFYKDMGSAHAVLNQSILNLPRWMPQVTTKPEALTFIEVLVEHEAIIRNFKEEHSLDYEMLRSYRDFLSSGKLHDFLAFTGQYSSYLTHEFEKKEKYSPKQFHTHNLEVLIVSHDKKLKPILDNEGFQRIAAAIRHSTVAAQYYRYKKNEKLYDIRYGLGQDLIRKGRYPQEFTKALSEFLAKYSHENAMVEEQANKRGQKIRMRPHIQPTDIDEIIGLIDNYNDSELVCNLLVAYGYATDYHRKDKSEDDNEPEINEAETDIEEDIEADIEEAY